jgi:DNA-directed RNA polymerase specialized sigma24 family protein
VTLRKGSTQNRKITKHICHQRLIDHAKRQRRRKTTNQIPTTFSSDYEEDPEFDSEDDEE